MSSSSSGFPISLSSSFMYRGRRLKSNGRERRVQSVPQPIAGFKRGADRRGFHKYVEGVGYVLDECHHSQTGTFLVPAGPGQHYEFTYQPPLEHHECYIFNHCHQSSPSPIAGNSVEGKAANRRMGSGSSKDSETSLQASQREMFDQSHHSASESRKNTKSKKAYHMVF